MKKLTRKSAQPLLLRRPAHYTSTPFLNFSDSPPPGEVFKIYSPPPPPLKRGHPNHDDISYHRQTKGQHIAIMKWMLEMLEKDPIKIPTPTHEQMMQIFQESWKATSANVNNRLVFKTNITLALDGSEDHLASTKLMNLESNSCLVSQLLL